VQVSVPSANNAALPSTISTRLTFNGVVGTTMTYSTTGFSPGDTFVLAAQSPTTITSTGRYGWSLTVAVVPFAKMLALRSRETSAVIIPSTLARSPLAQQQVHHPAAADVGAGATQVPQQVGVGAASLFEGVGQDREAGGVNVSRGQIAAVVGGTGEGHHLGRPAGGGRRDRAEWVAHDVTQQGALCRPAPTWDAVNAKGKAEVGGIGWNVRGFSGNQQRSKVCVVRAGACPIREPFCHEPHQRLDFGVRCHPLRNPFPEFSSLPNHCQFTVQRIPDAPDARATEQA
jgi:hypothetical protein